MASLSLCEHKVEWS